MIGPSPVVFGLLPALTLSCALFAATSSTRLEAGQDAPGTSSVGLARKAGATELDGGAAGIDARLSEEEAASLAVDDPLDALYRSTLSLTGEAEPVVTIRLMSGQREVRLRAPEGGLRVFARASAGEAPRIVHVPGGAELKVSALAHEPGSVLRFPIVAELPATSGGQRGLVDAVRTWRDRGHAVRVETVGGAFGLYGRVLDNRRALVFLDGPGDVAWAERAAEAASEHLEQTPVFHETRQERPTATLLLSDAFGSVHATAQSHARVLTEGDRPIRILGVEHGVGYASHGREDRTYRGVIHVVPDDEGLSVVNEVPLEELLRGIVPAETFASAHQEALKAQAVAARTDILAKAGVRHHADPALVCAETHCQVYKGAGAAVASTDAAIAATRGEVLIGAGGRLLDAVYSAMCGGHTESNEVVWGTPPDPALRGRLDLPAEGEWLRFAAGIGEDDVADWLARAPPSWCGRSSLGSRSRHRWSRNFTVEEIDALVAHLGVGSVRAIEVIGRGVSGRVRGVSIIGTEGSAVVRRELPVRRLFGNLPSGMFVVREDTSEGGRTAGFSFTGGGWGHGVGMCQTGAIGMAEHGYDHGAILRHYYNAAELLGIY